MPEIFISYRRKDSGDIVGRMNSWLTKSVVQENLYYDLISISPGEDFPSDINVSIYDCRLVIAIIGRNWALDENGINRFNDPGDWVRIEIESALKYGKPIIPVLIHDASFPQNGLLPPSFLNSSFQYINRLTIRPDPDFDNDMERLAIAISNIAPDSFYVDFTQDNFRLLFDLVTRNKYLKSITARYKDVKIPIESALKLPVNDIFQPLQLRVDPLASNSSEKPFIATSETILKEKQFEAGVIVDNIWEAIEKSPDKHLVILGGPGTGKTILLYKLATEIAERAIEFPKYPIPIYISLPHFAENRGYLDFDNYIKNSILYKPYADRVIDCIMSGQSFVCLDSLDEVLPKDREYIIDWINETCSTSKSTWLIGSRYTEYKGQQFREGFFIEWELLPLSPKTHTILAEKLFILFSNTIRVNAKHKIVHHNFLLQLERHTHYDKWGENPLLFTLCAYYFAKFGELPTSRSSLYSELIEAVLAKREPNAGKRIGIKFALAEIALYLYQSRGRFFSWLDLNMYISYCRAKLNSSWIESEMLQEILHSGLIEQVVSKVYGFRHQTFQEYFIAFGLASHMVSPDTTLIQDANSILWQKYSRSRWSEIYILFVGILENEFGKLGANIADKWLIDLASLHLKNEDPGYYGLLLAIRSLTEISEAQCKSKEVIVIMWLEEFIKLPKTKYLPLMERFIAHTTFVKHLPLIMGERIYNTFIQALDSGEAEQRVAFVKALGVLGDNRAVSRLCSLANDPSSIVRYAAVEVLAKIKGGDSLEGLKAFVSDPSWQIGLAAMEALRNFQSRELKGFFRIAISDPSWQIRRVAVQSLMECEDYGVDIFISALSDPKGEVVLATFQELSRIIKSIPANEQARLLNYFRTPFTTMRRYEIYIALWDILHSQNEVDSEVYLWVISDEEESKEAGGSLLADYDLEFEQNLSSYDQEELSRRDYLESLSFEPDMEIMNEDAWSTINAYLGKSRKDMIIYSDMMIDLLSALYLIGTQLTNKLLAVFFDAPDPAIVEAAIEIASKKQNNKSLIPLICKAVFASSLEVQLQAVEVIGRFRTKKVVKTLIDAYYTALINGGKEIREAILVVAGESELREYLPIVREGIHDLNPSVRGAAIEALAKLSDNSILESLLFALEDRSFYVQNHAATAFKHVKRKILVVDIPRKLINHNDHLIRAVTIHAIGNLTDPNRINFISRALEDQSIVVRKAAIDALSGISGHKQAELLIKAMKDTEQNLRSHAAKLAGNIDNGDVIPQILYLIGEDSSRVPLSAFNKLCERNIKIPTDIDLNKYFLSLDQRILKNLTMILSKVNTRSNAIFQILNTLLNSAHSEILVTICDTLASMRKNIPDTIITKLYHIRAEAKSKEVQIACDYALGEILSVDNIEDDWDFTTST